MESGIQPKASAQFLWNRVLDVLRNRIPETAFNTWFSHLGMIESGTETLIVGVPNTFVLEYVEHHYKAILESAVSEILGHFRSVEFAVTKTPVMELFHPASAEEPEEISIRSKSVVVVDATVPL